MTANESEDKLKLINFIKSVYRWLDTCYLQESEEVWPVIRPYVALRTEGKEAWNELKVHQSLNSFIKQIKVTHYEKLLAHGLCGAQLTYKLSVLENLMERMRRVRSPGRFRPKLIDAIDTILDSLIGAVGAGTALKEIKDMLRAQI